MLTISVKPEMTTSHLLVHLLPAVKLFPLENVISLSQNGNSSISCYCRIPEYKLKSIYLISLKYYSVNNYWFELSLIYRLCHGSGSLLPACSNWSLGSVPCQSTCNLL